MLKCVKNIDLNNNFYKIWKDISFIILNLSLILVKKNFQKLLNLETGFRNSIF